MQLATWWSVPQALAWIVTRSDACVERAAKLPTMHLLKFENLRPIAVGDDPPVTLNGARYDLAREASSGMVEVRGRRLGKGEVAKVPARPDRLFHDAEEPNRVFIGTRDDPFYDDEHWSDLFVNSEQCKAVWPAAERAGAKIGTEAPRSVEESTGTDSGSAQSRFDTELRRRIAEKVRGPEGHRDPMIGWAQHEFGLAPEAAEALWNGRAKEFPHKAGRPKRQKSG